MIPHAIDSQALRDLFDDIGEMPSRPDNVPLRERVLDRLADLMICADDILEMLATEPGGPLRACQSPIRSVYESINSLMKTLCD